MKEIVLQPTFYDKFECIGSKCNNDCCHGWSIGFTKEEFKNIKRKIHTEEFKKIFEDAFDIQKEKSKYIIKLDENKKCKFLDENGLCKMYKEVGHENMGLTCRVFPRRGTHYVDKYECFLSIACEEVVRLLTEEKDGIVLEVKEKELTRAEKEEAISVSAADMKKDDPIYYWTEFKILLLGVLQNREYNFGQRMVVLGIAMRKIDEMEKRGRLRDIPEYVNQFVDDFNSGKNKQMYTELFEKTDKNAEKRAFETLAYYPYSATIVQSKVEQRIEAKRKKSIKYGLKGNPLEGNEVLDIEYNTEKYQNAIKDFEEFIKGKEYWIENVMIEGFLSVYFPFWVEGGIWYNYCAMAIVYSTMLFALTCCLEKDSTKEDFMKYVSVVSRSTFHGKEYLETIEKVMKSTQSNTLAHMAVLVL